MSRTRTTTLVAMVVALMLSALTIPFAISPASAAVNSQSVPLSFSGDTGVIPIIPQTDNLVCDDCIPDEVSQFFGIPGATAYGGVISASAKVSWDAPASMGVSNDDALLEEGTTLDVKDAIVPLPGTLTVHAKYQAAFGFLNDANGMSDGSLDWTPIDLPAVPDATFSGTINDSGSVPCVMPLPGQPEHICTVSLGALPILSLPILPGLISVDLNAHLTMEVGITADGLTTVRSAHVNGGPSLGSDNLEFNAPVPATVDDNLPIPCGPAGKTLVYDVGTSTYDTTIDLDNALSIQLAFNVPDPFSDPSVDLFPLAQIIHNNEPLSLTSDGKSLELGQIHADSTPPSLGVLGPIGGPEGSPIPFNAVTDDNCGSPTLAWQFSDGGIAFGASPYHSFSDDGVFSGQVTATDFRGNTTTKNFTASVSNVAPDSNAGPDTTALWGVPVAFNGSAIDPSSADQSHLTYSWNFGDGSASGGKNASHTYANAGDYTATLSVCDDEGACDATPDTRVVHVTKRNTSVAYTGATSVKGKTNFTASASVADQLGQPVAGRTVRFTVGTQTASATTGANGVATVSMKNGLKAGSYTMTAELLPAAGESRYNGSSDSKPFKVS